MYGVIVVPTTATISSSTVAGASIEGRRDEARARPGAQSGCARTADAMYVTNTSADRQEDALHGPIAREEHERPDRDGHDRHGDVARDAEDLEGRRGARELGDRVGEVRDQQHEHRERPSSAPRSGRGSGPTRPWPVTTPRRAAISWTTARMTIVIGKSQSRLEAGLGAHDAVGRDAAGVVAGDAGDQARAHDREEGEQAAPATEPAAEAQELAVLDPVAESAERG